MSKKTEVPTFETIVRSRRAKLVEGSNNQKLLFTNFEEQQRRANQEQEERQLRDEVLKNEKLLKTRGWLNELNVIKLNILTEAQGLNLQPERIVSKKLDSKFVPRLYGFGFGKKYVEFETVLFDKIGYVFGAQFFENAHKPHQYRPFQNVSSTFNFLSVDGDVANFLRGAELMPEYLASNSHLSIAERAAGYTKEGLLIGARPRTQIELYEDPKSSEDFNTQRTMLAQFVVELETRSSEQ